MITWHVQQSAAGSVAAVQNLLDTTQTTHNFTCRSLNFPISFLGFDLQGRAKLAMKSISFEMSLPTGRVSFSVIGSGIGSLYALET